MKKQYMKILRKFNHASFQQQKQMYQTLHDEMNGLQELMLKMEETVNAQVFEPIDEAKKEVIDQVDAEKEALSSDH